MELANTTWTAGSWSPPLDGALDSASTLVLAFGAPELTAEGPIAELRAAFPRSIVVGCSSAGEIAQDRVLDGSLSVAVARFDRTHLRAVSTPVESPNRSREAGEALGHGLADPDLAAVLVFSDGLHVNGTELVRGLSGVLGHHVPVTGGLAGDRDQFRRTWVIRPTDGVSDHVVAAVGFYGRSLRVGHGSQGGWDPFGPERTVTRSEGNRLYELDGRPALALYEEYLGDRAAGLPATGLLFPLAVRPSTGEGRPLVRTILAIDRDAQALVFAGDIPNRWRAQLMRANFDRLVAGAAGAAAATAASIDGPALVVAISCVGRRLVLGERVEEEVEATLAAFPAGSIQAGFYSYGELSPVPNGPCDLHNQTMTLTALQEA